MNCITSFLPAVALASVSFITIYVFSLIDLIPTLKSFRSVAIPVALFLVVGVVSFIVLKNSSDCKLMGAGVIGLLIIIGFLLFYSSSKPFLADKELIKTIQDSNSGDIIFIYEYSEIPDGFIKSIVAIQDGWMPIEKNILEVSSTFSEVSNSNNSLILSFKNDSSLQYIYSDGVLKQVTN